MGATADDEPVNKVLLPIAGIPILARSVRTVLDVAGVHRIVLVVRPEDRDAVSEAVAPHLGAHDLWVVDGGAQRHDSEWQALQVLAEDIENDELDVVAIHDAARPLAGAELWRAVIDAAAEHGGAIPVVESPQLSRADGSLAPSGLVGVQTPQAFGARVLLDGVPACRGRRLRGHRHGGLPGALRRRGDRRRAEHDGEPEGDLPRGRLARRGAARRGQPAARLSATSVSRSDSSTILRPSDGACR